MQKRSVPAPYVKQTSAPLPDPQTSSAVNYVQIPENVMWLSGDRGFTKRPGSLTIATLTSGITTPVQVSGLVSSRTPAAIFATSGSTVVTGSVLRDATTVLATKQFVFAGSAITDDPGDSSPVVRLSKLLAFDLPDNYFFTRALYGNSVSTYGYSVLFGTQTLYPYGTQISSLAIPSATYNDFNQQSLPVTYLSVEAKQQDRSVVSATRSAIVCVPREAASPASNPRFAPAGNTSRIDAVSLGEGTFIGGAGGPIQYFDGFRTARAGATNYFIGTSAPTLNLSAGTLTGTYKYMYTQAIRLQSGEVIEGEPSPIGTTVPAAQNVTVSNVGTSKASGYEESGYTSNDSILNNTTFTMYPVNNFGTPVVIPLKAEPGQMLYFEQGGVVSSGRRIRSISGNSVTLTSGAPYTGTVNISTGVSWRIYRTKAGGDIFYLLTEFAGPRTSKSYVDSTADVSLVTQYTTTATTRDGSPLGVQSLTLHQGRIFAMVTNTSLTGAASTTSPVATQIMYSSSLSRHYYPTANTFDLPDDAGNPRALVSLNDTLYIFTDRKIFYTQGTFDDASTFTLNLLTSKYGCRDARSVISYGNQVLFVSDKGLIALSGTSIDEELGQPINKLIGKGTITSAYVWNAQNLLMLSVCNKKVVNSYATGANATLFNGALYSTNDIATQTIDTRGGYTLVYDLNSEKWAKWTINCFNGGCELDGDFLFTGGDDPAATSAPVRRLSLNNNWTDDGTAFTSRYYSEWYDAGSPAVDKSFNRAQVFSTDTLEAGGQNFQLDVSTERDWQPGLTVDRTTLLDFKYLHGYAEQSYDSQAYGDPELSQKVIPLSSQKAKSLRLVLENSEPNANIAINATNIEVNPKYVNMKDE